MLYLSLAVNALLVGLLVFDRFRYSAEIRGERNWHRTQQESLLNRIQAPEVAVAQSQPEPSGVPLHVPADDSPYADKVWDDLIED